MKLNFKRQAGATLLEIIMVVALVALFTIASLAYYNSAQNSTKVEETVSGVTALTSVIRNQFATQGDYSGITSDVVMRFGNVPEQMVIRNSSGVVQSLKHSWNNSSSAVTIGTETTNVANDSFSLKYNTIPAAMCVDLVTKTYRHFISVKVGSTKVTNVATATSACGTSGDVDITFVQR